MFVPSAPRGRPSLPRLVGQFLRPVLLLVPAAMLALIGLFADGEAQQALELGAAVELLLGLLLFFNREAWRPSIGMPVIALYPTALIWLWLWTTALRGNWYPHLAQGVLLLVPLVLFGWQTLIASGVTEQRRGRLLARRIAARLDWPDNAAACRALPEVKALREAIHASAAPALALLHSPRPEVRLAALAALEFRKTWEPGQADLVLRLAHQEPEPAVRAAAVTALGNTDERPVIEGLTAFLRDNAAVVRRAATEAILWDCERRWPWARLALHTALGDPVAAADGPLPLPGTALPKQAVADLTGWANENGVLGVRAALTLVAHYHRTLNEGANEPMLALLRSQLADTRISAVLRVELALLLHEQQQLPADLLEQLLDKAHPAPLRLLASEALLKIGPHASAAQTLREIARQPNRELALTAAGVVQRLLGVDLGLAVGQPLPPLHSRQAAEVTRRVMVWASQAPVEADDEATDDDLPEPAGRPTRRR